MSKIMTTEEMKPTPPSTGLFQKLLCWEGFLLAVTLAGMAFAARRIHRRLRR